MTTKHDKYFLADLEAVSKSYKDAMEQKDIKAIQGLASLDTTAQWAVANTGALIMSYLFNETLKNYNVGSDLTWLKYPIIRYNLGQRQINEPKINLVLDAFKEGGFTEEKEQTIKSLEGDKKIRLIRLTSFWKFFLTRYAIDKQQTITFPSVIGRQVYVSYLAKHKDSLKLPTGITVFKTRMIIFGSMSKDGDFNNLEGEKMFHKMGGAPMYYTLGENDQTKREAIRFFISDDGINKKVNPNSIYAYNKFIIPNKNAILNKQGLPI